MNLFRPALVTVLTAAVLAAAGCAAGGTAVQTSSSSPSVSPSGPANAPALEQAYVSVVAKVLPSVVQITSDRSLGSGIVFDTKGDIVTNAHVVGQATKFQVRLADNPKAIPATLVGAYRPDDLAVINSTSRHRRCTRRTSATPPGCRPATSCWPWATRSG